MKEIAILIPNIRWSFLVDDYSNYEYSQDDIFSNWMITVKRKVCDELFGQGNKPSRVYFGNEFCERLICSKNDVEKMATICAEKNMKMSLVTPYCSEDAISKIFNVLNQVKDLSVIDEIIVNDWGLLHKIREELPQYTCIIGRILDKMKRDPRLSKKEYEVHFSGDGLKMLQSPSASSESYQELMSDYQVKRFEIDNVIQGLYLDDISNMNISTYVPYGYVTNGKICQFAGIHNKKEDKFRVTTKCQHECQLFMQFMEKNLTALPSNDDLRLDKVQVIRKGNTVFYMNIEINQVMTDEHIDRIIYEPALPM